MSSFLNLLASRFSRRPAASLTDLRRGARRLELMLTPQPKETRNVTPADVNTQGRTPRFANVNIRTITEEGLYKSVYVYRCTTLIGLSLASIPWRGQRRVGDRWEDDPDGPLQGLIDDPNEAWSWARLMLHYTYHLTLGGESFVTKCRAESGAFERSHMFPDRSVPIAIWPHKADVFEVVPGKPGEPFVKLYKTTRNRAPDVEPQDMVHVSLPDPCDVYRGLSPQRPGQRAVDGDVAAQDWQNKSFENRAVPTGILTIEGDMDEDQWDETLERFRDRYAGAANSHGVMLWTDDVKFEAMAQTAVENDFLNTRKMNREEICAVWGVPPQMVGVLEFSTLANYQTAELIFWKHAVLPLLELTLNEFNQRLAPEWGDDVRFAVDISGVPALFLLFEQRWARALEAVDRGMPWRTANDRFQLGLSEWPGWEVGLIPLNVQPADTFSRGGFSEEDV